MLENFSVDSSRVIFSARLVSGYTIPEFSMTRGLISPMRDLLALSLLLQRYDTTEGRFSLPFSTTLVNVLCWLFQSG